MPFPGPPAEKEPPPPRSVCNVARAYISSEDIGRASKARCICVRGGSEGLIGGGRDGNDRKPPV